VILKKRSAMFIIPPWLWIACRHIFLQGLIDLQV
jgi:hypothetical protein